MTELAENSETESPDATQSPDARARKPLKHLKFPSFPQTYVRNWERATGSV